MIRAVHVFQGLAFAADVPYFNLKGLAIRKITS